MPDGLLLANAGDGMWVCVKGNKKARMRQQTGVKEGERKRGKEKRVQKGEHPEALFPLFFPSSFQERDDRWRLEAEGLRQDEKRGGRPRKDSWRGWGCGGEGLNGGDPH